MPSDKPTNVLDYAKKPRSAFHKFFTILLVRRRILIILGVLGLLVFVANFGPTSAEIRLDTGDLRYCWFGIPLRFKQMPEPQRSKLLPLAAKAPPIPARWVTCITYPLHTTNNPDSMYRSFYHSVAIWADEDQSIARWALEDLAHVLDKSRVPSNAWFPLVFGLVIDRGAGKIESNWRDDEDVQRYCSEHGYVPPPATAPLPPK